VQVTYCNSMLPLKYSDDFRNAVVVLRKQKNKADYIHSQHNNYWPLKGFKMVFERIRAPSRVINKNRPN